MNWSHKYCFFNKYFYVSRKRLPFKVLDVDGWLIYRLKLSDELKWKQENLFNIKIQIRGFWKSCSGGRGLFYHDCILNWKFRLKQGYLYWRHLYLSVHLWPLVLASSCLIRDQDGWAGHFQVSAREHGGPGGRMSRRVPATPEGPAVRRCRQVGQRTEKFPQYRSHSPWQGTFSHAINGVLTKKPLTLGFVT